MSNENWKLENDLCRCCHTEGTFKSLRSADSTMDNDEVIYSDMLRTCFDIEVSFVCLDPCRSYNANKRKRLQLCHSNLPTVKLDR